MSGLGRAHECDGNVRTSAIDRLILKAASPETAPIQTFVVNAVNVRIGADSGLSAFGRRLGRADVRAR